MTKQEVQKFRAEFQKSVSQLEKDFGVSISLGTIRFDANELRAKMTARKGEVIEKATKDDFKVGDTVKINHPKVDPNDQFRVIKIMFKNIKLERINGNGLVRVSPSFLVKL
jgi:hypothetical protein